MGKDVKDRYYFFFFFINSLYIWLSNESSHSRRMIQYFVELQLQSLQVLSDVYNAN